MSKILRLQSIFRDVLADESLVLSEAFSRADCADWDSVATVQLVLAVEADFGIQLPTELVGGLRSVQQLLPYLPD